MCDIYSEMLGKKWVDWEYEPETNRKIARIIEIEWKITDAVRNGLRASTSDEFKDLRKEAEQLRKDIGIR